MLLHSSFAKAAIMQVTQGFYDHANAVLASDGHRLADAQSGIASGGPQLSPAPNQILVPGDGTDVSDHFTLAVNETFKADVNPLAHRSPNGPQEPG